MKKTQIHREQTSGYQWREGNGGGQYRDRGQEVQSIMYKINYKDILYRTGNTANIL